jgi:hypothetical protein
MNSIGFFIKCRRAGDASFWRDPDVVKGTTAAFLQAVEAACTDESLISK